MAFVCKGTTIQILVGIAFFGQLVLLCSLGWDNGTSTPVKGTTTFLVVIGYQFIFSYVHQCIRSISFKTVMISKELIVPWKVPELKNKLGDGVA